MGASSKHWQRAQNPRGDVSDPSWQAGGALLLYLLFVLGDACIHASSLGEPLPGPTPHVETGEGRHLLGGGPMTPAEVVCSWVHRGVTGNSDNVTVQASPLGVPIQQVRGGARVLECSVSPDDSNVHPRLRTLSGCRVPQTAKSLGCYPWRSQLGLCWSRPRKEAYKDKDTTSATAGSTWANSSLSPHS